MTALDQLVRRIPLGCAPDPEVGVAEAVDPEVRLADPLGRGLPVAAALDAEGGAALALGEAEPAGAASPSSRSVSGVQPVTMVRLSAIEVSVP
ncbi:hypothetical protein [Micromonospora sp. CA-246542]|uniref:hypothetical protein n=1 Tax=Micromonospora sp. CA-246542 TaxID=3239959 RepID=UPI003D94BFDD